MNLHNHLIEEEEEEEEEVGHKTKDQKTVMKTLDKSNFNRET